MKHLLFVIWMIIFLLNCQQKPQNYVVLEKNLSQGERVARAAQVVPSERQMRWQEREFIAFVHFGMNTITDREWGQGDENPAWFNPTNLDARQWARVCKEAGIRMIIVTAKHHDGFCLWPSRYTAHSVKASPWKNGQGDVVAEVAAACREYGLEFGVYLSPWDRHEPSYGDSPRYNAHFKNQLRELLSDYGPIAEVWFDGACGEGPNGKRQEYDWPGYYQLIRELQPEAVIAIMGPDVRWVGTESGYGRETEWSVLPAASLDPDQIAALSQHDINYIPQGDLTAEDLGSREKIQTTEKLVWYPAETDVSIRPGWFYHAHEDALVKSPEKLLDIYYSSVGRNSVLLLNIPPDQRGLIHEIDTANLLELRRVLNATFAHNLINDAQIQVSNIRAGSKTEALLDTDLGTYWTTDPEVETASLEFILPEPRLMDRLLLQENIRLGQRIESFTLEAWLDSRWQPVTVGTTVGYKRLLRFAAVTTDRLRLTINAARTSPTLATVGLYQAPPEVIIEPATAVFRRQIKVSLRSNDPAAHIFYSLDGTSPVQQVYRYEAPLQLDTTTVLKAVAVNARKQAGLVKSAEFLQAFSNLQLLTPVSEKYPARGALTLVDGQKGTLAFADGNWQGFEGNDLMALIDFGSVQPVHQVTLGCLQDPRSWIFLPTEVSFRFSSDGQHYHRTVTLKSSVADRDEQVLRYEFGSTGLDIQARFVQVQAKNRGLCPDWHVGAGGKAWIFVDEIEFE